MKLADDLARALDPVSVFTDFGMQPDPWQVELLSIDIKRALVLCARQVGKSTTAAILALHTVIYRPRSLVLLVSPSLRQSSELFRKCAGFYHMLGEPERLKQESALSVELRNGSRIVSLPGSGETIRGYSAAAMVVCDEAARCSDELLTAVRPMLAVSNGRLLMLSTPWGRRGAFYNEWTHGGPQWHRTMVTAAQCPRISSEFLADEERALGPWLYKQEYCCEFVDEETQLFNSELIEQAMSEDVRPLF